MQKQNIYMYLINCETEEEVKTFLGDALRGRPEDEHLIRSEILDVHAMVERKLKRVLYQILKWYVFNGSDETEYQQRTRDLEKVVFKLGFGGAYRILKPLFEAFPADDLSDIQKINDVRNAVVHREDMAKVKYKGRCPFADPDCLAQLYFDAWAARFEMQHFLDRMVDDPRAIALHYAKFYQENYDRIRDTADSQGSSSCS